MNKHTHTTSLILISVCLIVLLLFIEAVILINRNIKSADKTLNILMNQVTDVIKRSENLESALTESQKEDYIIRAKTVSYIIENSSSSETDIEKLNEIAALMNVDEIHLFDKTGTIYGGTIEKYYGLDMDSGDQISYFKPMLSDTNLSMCQDPTPNTAENKNMMYALVWREDKKGMVQIGLKPTRLMEELSSYSLANIIQSTPLVDGVTIHVENLSTRENYSSKGVANSELSTDSVLIKKWCMPFSSIVNHTPVRCLFKVYGRYNIGIIYDMTSVNKGVVPSIVVMLIYLILSAGVISLIIHRMDIAKEKARIQLQESKDESERQLKVLQSMAEMYYSMHLIDLASNGFTAITSRKVIDSYITDSTDAAKAIYTASFNLSSSDYRDLLLEFTDLSTIRERFRNKKSEFIEFTNYEERWFRAGFITIEADDDGYPERVIYATQLIDAEKRREAALIQRSNTDELTDCYNRRAFEEDINGYSQIGIPSNFALLSMDVNGLKQVNDSLGHAAGDELLLGAVQCMNDAFGSYGKLYRTGGDEFMAILAVSSEMLPALISKFSEITASWHGTVVKELSVSVGYICSDEASSRSLSIQDIERIVDKRMYCAKARFYSEHGIDRRGQ